MSTSAITLWALVLAGTSLVLLVVLDHRKPARRHRVAPRARLLGGREPIAMEVVQLPTVQYRRTPLWRRLLSLGELGLMGVVLGAMTAMTIAVVAIGGLWLLDSLSR